MTHRRGEATLFAPRVYHLGATLAAASRTQCAAAMTARLALLGLLAVVRAGGLDAAPAPVQAAPGEYEVKAAFLLNFARFVEWPAAAPEARVVAVIGEDPFGSVLDQTFESEASGGSAWEVQRLPSAEAAPRSRILFISRSEEGRLPLILDRVRDAPVLTVSDIPHFAERGGMIGLRLEQRKVRFDIAPDTAARAGLKLSSQLLKLARIVPGTKSP